MGSQNDFGARRPELLKQLKAAGERGRTIRACDTGAALQRLVNGATSSIGQQVTILSNIG
jgi:hypothetical protein